MALNHVGKHLAAFASLLLLFASDAAIASNGVPTSNANVNQTFLAAEQVCNSNIRAYQAGALSQPQRVLMAGASYPAPFTRDGSINAWNGVDLVIPGVGKNTLLSLLTPQGDQVQLGRRPFDEVIWVPAAWSEYLYSGDSGFLRTAFVASVNTVKSLEVSSFDSDLGLFRGPGVSCDVTSGFPDRYDSPDSPTSRMHSLSLNCTYYAAYKTLELMARELKQKDSDDWAQKADALKNKINEKFWDEQNGMYRYIVDIEGGDDSQEALGIAFAILYNIADPEKQKAIFNHVQISKHGIAGLWPPFPRFARAGGFGNHSGLIWPFMQPFWAEACKKAGRLDLFDSEFANLTRLCSTDGWFYQSYDPVSGKPSGGIAAVGNNRVLPTGVRPYQSWTATAYLRIVLLDAVGMNFDTSGVKFEPHLPATLSDLKINGVHYHNSILNLHLEGQGSKITKFLIDGKQGTGNRFPSNQKGTHTIVIILGNAKASR